MYFWKIENLKKDIQEKKITEKDNFIYFFITTILGLTLIDLDLFISSEGTSIWDILNNAWREVSNVFIVILGILFAFKANGGTSGTNFLEKFFSISFVISIRFTDILILIFIGLGLHHFFFKAQETTFLDTFVIFIWHTGMYWRIFKHIRDVKDS
jgi:hypothetical protein